ncbi:MAG TPA: DUF6268 family outer membrane beta-barrel protein [Polyangiaceae bacterium]|nr:DUF6268 family outer membrane beta-barrel protein [Polyangiaceae bacterium]
MLKRSFTALAAIATFLGTGSARAQVADSLASISYERYPSVSAPLSAPGDIGLQVFRFRAGYPIFLSKQTILIPGLAYELIDVQRHGGNGPDIGLLHAPTASLTLVQKITDRISVIGVVGGGFASDFQDRVSVDDLQVNLTAFGLYKFSDTLSLGAGVSYTRQTGTLTPLPAIALNWQPVDRFRVRGFVPALVNIEYRVTPWLTAGIRGTIEGNRYHISEKSTGLNNLQLAYSVITVGPKVTFRLADLLHLDVYAAGAFNRRFETFVDGNSTGSAYLAPVVFFGARLWVGPSGWRDDSATQPPAPQPPESQPPTSVAPVAQTGGGR